MMRFAVLILFLVCLGCAQKSRPEKVLKQIDFVCPNCGWDKTAYLWAEESQEPPPLCHDCKDDYWQIKGGYRKLPLVMPTADSWVGMPYAE